VAIKYDNIKVSAEMPKANLEETNPSTPTSLLQIMNCSVYLEDTARRTNLTPLAYLATTTVPAIMSCRACFRFEKAAIK
jgi:hypothetical protein